MDVVIFCSIFMQENSDLNSLQPSKVVCPKTQLLFQAKQRCILGARQQPSSRFLIMTASHLPLHCVLSFHLYHVL